MYGNMTLGDLIDWLEKQDQSLTVKDGFGSPHSDRGSYDELAFTPEPKAKISDMLKHAKSADGATFTGWKGGEYKMNRNTSVYIGEYGSCGEEITILHFKYWLLTAAWAKPEGAGWISVEERLPEKGQIVAFITHCPRDDYYDKRVFGGKYLGDGEFVTNGLGIQASHWMPLPEPPAIVGKKEGV